MQKSDGPKCSTIEISVPAVDFHRCRAFLLKSRYRAWLQCFLKDCWSLNHNPYHTKNLNWGSECFTHVSDSKNRGEMGGGKGGFKNRIVVTSSQNWWWWTKVNICHIMLTVITPIYLNNYATVLNSNVNYKYQTLLEHRF